MRLDIDTEVRFPTGERAGFLRKVIVDENNEVSEVVMGTDELLSRRVLVPITYLSEEPGGGLAINIEPGDLDTLEPYEEERLPAINEGWEFGDNPTPLGEVFPATAYQPIIPVVEAANVPEGSVMISQGTEIWCLNELWGIVDEVVIADDGKVTGFVGRPNDTSEHDRLIPLGLVQDADANRVTLNCTTNDLETYSEALVNQPEEPEV